MFVETVVDRYGERQDYCDKADMDEIQKELVGSMTALGIMWIRNGLRRW